MSSSDRGASAAAGDPPPGPRRDEELMGLVRAGQEAPLETLMARYGEDLVRFFRLRSGDPHLALDLANETFYRIFSKAGTYESTKPFRPWFFAVATNVWRAWRRRPSPPEVPLERIPEQAEEREPAAASERPEGLWRLLDALSETDREILLLRHFEGLKLKEIARRLGLSPGAVYTRLSRSLDKLRGRPGGGSESL